jgi:protein phosphatase 2C family protein 2/3
MDLDQRFRPGNGLGGRIILLGDGTEISTDAPDSEMFDQDDEDKDLDSQVDKYNTRDSAGDQNAPEETPGPHTAESPSSVKTENSDAAGQTASKDTPSADKSTTDERPKSTA